MIKIFSPNKTIYLTSSKPTVKPNKNSIFIETDSKDELRKKYFEVINKKDLNEIYFYNPSEKILISFFSDLFHLIEAAGGLVKNNNEEWLFIFRNGKWDLPKGKIEKGEAVKKAAIREVEEECGIGKLKIIKEIPSTYHTYFMNGKEILKRTYWFEMFSDDNNKLTPQLEEGITEVKWIAAKDLKQVYDNTFESVKEVLKGIE